MRHLPALLPFLLAACAAEPPAALPRPLTPQEQACATQADHDPALEQARAIAAGRLDWEYKHEAEMRQLRQDAITRCLRARGLAPRGGVERPG